MSYKINHYNGSLIATIADGTIDNTLDITLVGKNYAGYGKTQNENFVYLLENFAGSNPPAGPIPGQVWFDSGNRKLKFYDGSGFRIVGGAEVSPETPTGLSVGDFWFDTANNQLHAYTGTGFTLIGPQVVTGAGATEMLATSVVDSDGVSWPIIEAVTDGAVVFTISSNDDFTIDATLNPIAGFTKIRKGVTLAYTGDTGVSANDFWLWGTASNADKLDGLSASDFVRSNSGVFSDAVNFADVGFTVGNPVEKLRIFNSASTTPTISNIWGEQIRFTTTVNSLSVTPLVLSGLHLLPGATDTTNLGSSDVKFNNVWANNLNGTATEAIKLRVGAVFTEATIASSAGSVVARTLVDEVISGKNITAGAIKGTYFVGTATSANYADLAEKYLADAEYAPGTVVCIGGEKEVTASTWGKRAIGAVSTDPAYMMNSELEGGTYIALKGRVPVKVVGRIKKGEELIAADNGCAMMAVPHASRVFAVALETNDDHGVKLVECLIL